MTNKELQEILKKYPDDIIISVRGYEEGITDLDENNVIFCNVRLNAFPQWYNGEHELDENSKDQRLLLDG